MGGERQDKRCQRQYEKSNAKCVLPVSNMFECEPDVRVEHTGKRDSDERVDHERRVEAKRDNDE